MRLVLLAAISSPACVDRARLNPDCLWTHDAGTRLDPFVGPAFRLAAASHHAAAQRQMVADVTAAEEIAIRYADVRRGVRSGHFDGHAVYASTRDECFGALVTAIARNHGVSERDVRAQVGRRIWQEEVAIGSAFVVLYALFVYGITGWIARTVDPREQGRIWIAAVLVGSMVVSAAGIVSGELWSALVESMRLGTTHLSYRAGRLPWTHHRPALFAGAMLIFWAVSWKRRRARSAT